MNLAGQSGACRDEEVMELEGLMEGCKDEGVQFITVKRPAAAIRSGSVVVGADVAPQSTIRVSEALYNGATGLDWVNGEGLRSQAVAG